MSAPRHAPLLIVEDDDLLRNALKEQLAAQGDFAVIEEASTGVTGITAAKSTVFDIILLDIGLPDMDGRDVCQKMREAGVRSPIIMLTARREEIDRIAGLEMGADDYIVKPFFIRELIARVKVHFRSEKPVSKILRGGELELDRTRRIARIATQELSLTATEFNQLGIYTLYIRPAQIRTSITDCSVLSALPNVKGIVIDTNNVPSAFRNRFIYL